MTDSDVGSDAEEISPIIDCDVLEAAKENIQPLAKGRRATALSAILATPLAQRENRLAATRQRLRMNVEIALEDSVLSDDEDEEEEEQKNNSANGQRCLPPKRVTEKEGRPENEKDFGTDLEFSLAGCLGTTFDHSHDHDIFQENQLTFSLLGVVPLVASSR